jgi:hypothetical protein
MPVGVYTAACFQTILQLMGTRWLESSTLHASHAPRSKARMMKQVPRDGWRPHAVCYRDAKISRADGLRKQLMEPAREWRGTNEWP